IGVVGPNGSGKTTLLKLLAGRGAPDDRGQIKRGTNLQEGYFDQHLGELNPNLTAVDEVRTIRGDFTIESARQYLARFRFWGDDPLRKVAGFSGGERSRLALAKLLLEPRNLLFLDEPTNHLDIPAAEILEEANTGFDGTMILVSHDRRFLETTTSRIVSVRDGKVDIYPGGFRDFVAAQTPKADDFPPLPAQKKKESVRPPPKEEAQGRVSFEAQRLAAREKERKKRRIVELEQTIASGEKELAGLRADLREDPQGNWEKLAQMAKAEQALTKRVDAMMSEWARLSEEES
ncbi:MAG: ATP-binding cassette domain-containing protein, partial [Polyangiaceae bacterium]